MAMEVAKKLDMASIMQEGVYAMVGGPNFESIAEGRLLHCLGVDAVGKTYNHNLTILRGRIMFWVATVTSYCDCKYVIYFIVVCSRYEHSA